MNPLNAPTFEGIASTLVAATPTSEANFFGFYDICPFSPSNDELVLLSCPQDFLRMPAGEVALVRVWNPENGTFDTVGETRGWNWQHGARQRWLSDGTILFNDLENGRQVARQVGRDGKLIRTIPMAVGALNASETIAVSGNYERLAKYYDTYGYHAARNDHIDQSPQTDGLWAVDFATGDVRLLLSYSRIAEEIGAEHKPSTFVSHPDFAPGGDIVSFFHIDSGARGTSFMRLLVYRFSTDELTLIGEEKVSHPAWIDDKRLWTWARQSSALKLVSRGGLLAVPGVRPLARLARRLMGSSANALLDEGFFVVQLDGMNSRMRVAADSITEDGHFSKHPEFELMLGDTYPDEAENRLTLLLYSLAHDRRVPIARILHDVRTDDARLRCDLHPRWDRTGGRACFDFMHEGVRRVGIVDASQGIAAAGFGSARV
ncbi:MAG: hypothetical protein WA910_00485 [Sphingopyxis granuli]